MPITWEEDFKVGANNYESSEVVKGTKVALGTTARYAIPNPHQMITGSLKIIKVTVNVNPYMNFETVPDLTAKATDADTLFPGITYTVKTVGRTNFTTGTAVVGISWADGVDAAAVANDDKFTVTQEVKLVNGAAGFGNATISVLKADNDAIMNNEEVMNLITKGLQRRATTVQVGKFNATASAAAVRNNFRNEPMIDGVGANSVRYILENEGTYENEDDGKAQGYSMMELEDEVNITFGNLDEGDIYGRQQVKGGMLRKRPSSFNSVVTIGEIDF